MRALLARLSLLAIPAVALAQRPLPPLHDGTVISGPGEFRHDGELLVQGTVTLSNMTLDLHGPIRVSTGSTLELNDVHLIVSDPEGAPNGTSGLTCDGPAHIKIRRSTMTPVGRAHPMWQIRGDLDVVRFTTLNSEFHLKQVKARLNQFKIFELEISEGSQVTAKGLDLVFLSTHSGEDDHLHFANIPVDRAFTQTLDLGSGAHAQITDSRMQMFLLYIHGHSEATLEHLDRVQLALFPDCDGILRLPKGRLGSETEPAVFPDAKSSNCRFHISLNEVNVDTLDIYAAGHAKLTVEDSRIDELIASDHANISVRNSTIYADWLAVSGDASMTVENSTVGALRLAAQRPDLATSQIRISGRGRAVFSGVRFDCGIVAADDAHVDISHAAAPPKYARHSGNAVIRVNGEAGSGSR
jgi:hypothetical protein